MNFLVLCFHPLRLKISHLVRCIYKVKCLFLVVATGRLNEGDRNYSISTLQKLMFAFCLCFVSFTLLFEIWATLVLI